MSATWPLPDDIDATYPDRSAGDRLHQQHHDAIHAALSAAVDPATGLPGTMAAENAADYLLKSEAASQNQ